jgi:segregation and condensation protein A
MSSLDAFYLSLTDFEGPLPLLLHLIEKNELEVTRVSIAAVADQFVALVASGGAADLSTTGEFVAVAARLLLIKSRALLFRDEFLNGIGDDRDDATLLARQIAEYSMYQAAARAIAGMLDADMSTRPRPDTVRPPTFPVQAPPVRVDALVRAGRRLLARRDALEEDITHWPEVIYAMVRSDLLAEVRRLQSTTFSALCRRDWHPLVVVTMFLAVLDAVRADQLSMRQAAAFGPIELCMPGNGAAYA